MMIAIATAGRAASMAVITALKAHIKPTATEISSSANSIICFQASSNQQTDRNASLLFLVLVQSFLLLAQVLGHCR